MPPARRVDAVASLRRLDIPVEILSCLVSPAFKNGQYVDLEGAGWRAIAGDEPAP
jgi:hypothetical protein